MQPINHDEKSFGPYVSKTFLKASPYDVLSSLNCDCAHSVYVYLSTLMHSIFFN